MNFKPLAILFISIVILIGCGHKTPVRSTKKPLPTILSEYEKTYKKKQPPKEDKK